MENKELPVNQTGEEITQVIEDEEILNIDNKEIGISADEEDVAEEVE